MNRQRGSLVQPIVPPRTCPLRDTDSIRLGRAWVQNHVENPGIICPLCDQHAVERKRTISKAMAIALVLLERFHRKNPRQWMHVEKHFKNDPDAPVNLGGDLAKLRHFGLVLLRAEQPGCESFTGEYKITATGRRFVAGKHRTYKWVKVFNRTIRGRSDKKVCITDIISARVCHNLLAKP